MPRTRIPRALSFEQMDDLLEFLDERLHEESCDGSMRHVRAFLLGRGLQVPPALRWLQHRGAYCDCEVWMNVR